MKSVDSVPDNVGGPARRLQTVAPSTLTTYTGDFPKGLLVGTAGTLTSLQLFDDAAAVSNVPVVAGQYIPCVVKAINPGTVTVFACL